MELSRRFFQGSDIDRKLIFEGWDFGVEWKYPNQFALCGTKNQKGTSMERILASLLYYSLSGERGDSRDVILAYAVIYNSCKLLGFDANEIFRKVSHFSKRRASDSIINFLNRRESDKSIDAFMLKIRDNEFSEKEFFIDFGD